MIEQNNNLEPTRKEKKWKRKMTKEMKLDERRRDTGWRKQDAERGKDKSEFKKENVMEERKGG